MSSYIYICFKYKNSTTPSLFTFRSQSYQRINKDTTHPDKISPPLPRVPSLQVLDLFIRKYPLALNFIVPKLADFPSNALPPPQHEFSVTVLGTFVPVQIHVLVKSIYGYRRTFLLVSSQVFDKRTARTIYQ